MLLGFFTKQKNNESITKHRMKINCKTYTITLRVLTNGFSLFGYKAEELVV